MKMEMEIRDKNTHAALVASIQHSLKWNPILAPDDHGYQIDHCK